MLRPRFLMLLGFGGIKGGDGGRWGVRITYIPQAVPGGLAQVVQLAEPFIGKDRFIFYLGDNMVVGGVRRVIDEFERSDANCFLTLARVRDPERFGVPEIRDGRIVAVEEQPANPKSSYAVAGIKRPRRDDEGPPAQHF